jgi:uncharacterized cupin superfamily protein
LKSQKPFVLFNVGLHVGSVDEGFRDGMAKVFDKVSEAVSAGNISAAMYRETAGKWRKSIASLEICSI